MLTIRPFSAIFVLEKSRIASFPAALRKRKVAFVLDWRYFWRIMQIFLGVLLLLGFVALLGVQLVLTSGIDAALALLTVMLLLGGLLCVFCGIVSIKDLKSSD